VDVYFSFWIAELRLFRNGGGEGFDNIGAVDMALLFCVGSCPACIILSNSFRNSRAIPSKALLEMLLLLTPGPGYGVLVTLLIVEALFGYKVDCCCCWRG